ncbi:uncharacterized protein GVI51_I01463 [Nakaseomyces glabratus]|uniref:Cleavage/polyadenylation specificity factor A subunit N-terminal domain-containing protein n=1 Tax=Candida glabrata (strain ATCC 2001 / BCRC 20586 / JCM 3761 / NBRC 0622 / NRRL Y-65 / CBS 138) TaxID=284593 RepID=Q6FR19_CANGA|nr:uncharacterized protein CAGL0I01650g [Nakaseomyces glabratus]KAH7599581.1 hypothetical protein J7294_02596 [Nakaseomyces glabratus]KAH7604412.1 hypothetical protein J7293_02586 [Nakaseomyces glabratus]QHS66970.1 uncharacterized protein GVI51_I01463 [Nakaseomyces glabratus]CAG60262.1 unnamed protein product [Nakaseomyces glabratus]|eukprot:XP_447325.1 uncharacterized protein CAGL0I01650g [[Candida] glabrata]
MEQETVTAIVLRERLCQSPDALGYVELEDGSVVVVRCEWIDHYGISESVVLRSRVRCSGYIVAFCEYKSGKSGGRYLLLLNSAGTLFVRELSQDPDSGQLQDGYTLQYSIDIPITATFCNLRIDNELCHIYFNATDLDVYLLKFYDKKQGIEIHEGITTDGDSTRSPIYSSFGKIKTLKLCRFYEEERDVSRMELSLITYKRGRWIFETCSRQSNKLDSRWSCTRCLQLPQTLHLLPFSSPNNEYVFAYIPSFGYYILSLDDIFVIPFVNGFLCDIGGVLVQDLTYFEGLRRQIDITETTTSITTDLVASEDTSRLNFWFLTDKDELIVVKINIIQTDALDSVTHMNRFQFEVVGIDQPTNSDISRDQISLKKIWQWQRVLGRQYSISINDQKLPTQRKRNNEGPNMIYDYKLSQVPIEILTGCDYQSNSYYLEVEYNGLPVPQPPSNGKEKNIEKCWHLINKLPGTPRLSYFDGEALIWKDNCDNIYSDQTLQKEDAPFDFIVNGAKIEIKNNINDITFFRLKNSTEYCFVSFDGYLNWSFSDSQFNLRDKITNPTLKNVKINTTVIGNNVVLTYAIIDKHVLCFLNTELKSHTKLQIDVSRVTHFDFNTCSESTDLLLLDPEGVLHIVRADSDTLISKYHFCLPNLRFAKSSKVNEWLIYSSEYIAILNYDIKLKSYTLKSLFLPVTLATLVGFGDDNIYAVSESGLFIKMDRDLLDLSPKQIKNRVRLDYKLVAISFLPFSYRYVVGHVEKLGNDEKDPDNIVALIDIINGTIVDEYTTTINRENRNISSMSPLFYKEDNILLPELKGETSYAKKYAVSHCFAVLLSPTNLEDNLQNNNTDNLLIFSVDEDLKKIKLETMVPTNSNASIVENFYYRTFMVAGDTVALYELDYLVKENRFTVQKVSNEVGGSLVLGAVNIYHGISNNGYKERNRKASISRITLLDKFRGILEYSILLDDKKKPNSQPDDLRLRIIPMTSKDVIPISSIIHEGDVIDKFEVAVIGDYSFFAVVYNNRKLIIFFQDTEELLGYHTFNLPATVETISSPKKVGQIQESMETPLFYLITTQGTRFNIVLTKDFQVSESALEEQESHLNELEYSDGRNDASIFPFIDTRILTNML